MSEHWCPIHNQVFFKKGKMRGFAHPYTDEAGNDHWCNEPGGGVVETEAKVDTKPMEESTKAGKEAREKEPTHIEYNPSDKAKFRSMAMSYAKDMAAAGVIPVEPTEINKWANYFYVYIVGGHA